MDVILSPAGTTIRDLYGLLKPRVIVLVSDNSPHEGPNVRPGGRSSNRNSRRVRAPRPLSRRWSDRAGRRPGQAFLSRGDPALSSRSRLSAAYRRDQENGRTRRQNVAETRHELTPGFSSPRVLSTVPELFRTPIRTDPRLVPPRCRRRRPPPSLDGRVVVADHDEPQLVRGPMPQLALRRTEIAACAEDRSVGDDGQIRTDTVGPRTAGRESQVRRDRRAGAPRRGAQAVPTPVGNGFTAPPVVSRPTRYG